MDFLKLRKSNTVFNSRPIFIGGDGRSGTTLLSVILDSHPELCVGPELHFAGPPNLGPYLIECVDLLIADDPRGYGRGLKEHGQFKTGVQFAKRCHRMGVEFSDLRRLVEDQMKSIGSNLSRFEDRCGLIEALGEFAQHHAGKSRWGMKIMRDIRNLRDYHKCWPNAQFIHLIRDGRDVAASQMLEHGTWGYQDIADAAKGWVELIEKVRRNSRGIPTLEVRYEDLVLNARSTLERIVQFLGVEFDERLVSHHEVEHSLFENPYNHPSMDTVVQPINGTAVGRYVRDLKHDQISSFNQVARRMLVELGYEAV